jgi:hypothetical protein
MAISRPNWSANVAAYLNASFHFGVMKTSRFSNDLWCIQPCIEILKTTDPGALHPFQIRLDPFLSNIAAHPVPPYAWLGAVGGLESPAAEDRRLDSGYKPPKQWPLRKQSAPAALLA